MELEAEELDVKELDALVRPPPPGVADAAVLPSGDGTSGELPPPRVHKHVPTQDSFLTDTAEYTEMLQTIAWFERTGCDPARPARFALLCAVLLLLTFGLSDAIFLLHIDPGLSPLGRWRPMLPFFIQQAALFWDLPTMYIFLMRNKDVVSWWHCRDDQRAAVAAAMKKRLDARIEMMFITIFMCAFILPFYISLQTDVSALSVTVAVLAITSYPVWTIWHSYMDAVTFSFVAAFVQETQEQFEKDLFDERTLGFQQALARYAEMSQQSRASASQATSQFTGMVLLVLIISSVALYDLVLMPWRHPVHVLLLLNTFIIFPFLVGPIVQIGDTFQANLVRRLSGSDGVGKEDGSKQLWSAQERVQFIQHIQASHVPLTLVGLEMHEGTVKLLVAGAFTAATSFVEYTLNRGWEGFAFDRFPE
jgi:hypothetical protein